MSVHKHQDEDRVFLDFNHEEEGQSLSHKRHIRQLLEKKLERKRLKEELEYFDGELDGDFDWDELEK